MPRSRAAFFLLPFLLAPAVAPAQSGGPLPPVPAATPATSLRGRFVDAVSRAPVAQVQVKLTAAADSSRVLRATASDSGRFELAGLQRRSYWLEASRLGYATLRQLIRVTQAGQDAGLLALTPESIPIEGVTVRESPPPAIQKADTTEYQAGAVQTHRDATAEDLVQKLPGVTVEGGQVRAQGEAVQQVLVNGRPFFGSDPTAAMRNLPAEVVDRIQVYDRMSDQAEFSGFDDGQSQKTMNFILRQQRTRFGKVYGGTGDQDRYQSGGNLTMIRGAHRFTAIGMSNNINQTNFSPQDLFGSLGGGAGAAGGAPRILMIGGPGGRPRGPGGGAQVVRLGGGFGGGAFDPGSFLVGPQAGISTTHSGGINFVSERSERLTFSGSVFANGTDTDNVQTLTREFVPVQSPLAFYQQRATTDSRSSSQRLDGRLEWTPDSANSVILQPRLYFQGTEAASVGDAANVGTDGAALSDARSDTRETVDGNNLSGRLTLRHRFATRGRNVSAELNRGHNLRDAAGAQASWSSFHDGATTTGDTLDQISGSRTTTDSYSARLVFTEPLAPGLQVQAIYHPSLTRSVADARGWDLDPVTGVYSRPDSALSNSFENRSTVHRGGFAALYRQGPWRLLTNASYQRTRLESEQTFPGRRTIDHSFGDFVPSATLTGSFANRRNLRVAWTTSSNAPSIAQLQNVVNNSNPLSLSTGNPDLRPTYAHSLAVRFSEADPTRSRSRFLFLNLTRTSHPIANATFTAPVDTTVDGVFLAGGTQLSRPVNLDQSWSGNLFAVWSRPTRTLQSVLSLNGGGSFSRTPTLVNGVTGVGSTVAVRSGAVLSSNVSPNLDFTVSYWGTYNRSRNTRSSSRSGDYFTHTASLRLNSVVGPGIVVRQEVSHNLQSGVPSAYGRNLVLWNATVGKKFLKDQRGEIRVTATDALEQDRSVSRSVTESYVQDSRDRTLGRFVQAVLTYTFR